MKALCSVHAGCAAGRNCRDWRPAGRLWWWLSAADDYPSKEAHQAAVPTFAQRSHARDAFRLVLGCDEL